MNLLLARYGDWANLATIDVELWAGSGGLLLHLLHRRLLGELLVRLIRSHTTKLTLVRIVVTLDARPTLVLV